MAKQKKVQSRRVPRASNPRMYGDGKSSETTDNTQAATQPTTSGIRTAGSGGASVTPAVRSAGTTPRTSTGAGGSYALRGLSMTTDYTYVRQDLRRLGVVAASILGLLVVLSIVIP